MKLSEDKQKQHLSVNELLDIAWDRNEGSFTSDKAFSVLTGKRTGRSPRDRFIVCDDNVSSKVDWGGVNQPAEPEHFERLWAKACDYIKDKEHYVSELQVGADSRYALPVKVITERAWHNVFCQHLFIGPRNPEVKNSEWTLLNVAGLVLSPEVDGTSDDGVVMINFTQKKVLLCGMRYAGEMKKAMFTALNYWLPDEQVLPMHCAANAGESGDVALFFGLSGTGKTTLSADPSRYLIGDDEHGWGKDGVFNFEGGCYAKTIDLSHEREPVIWDAISQGAILENVFINEDGVPDYTDSRYTLNSRAAYPRHHIPKRVMTNKGCVPKSVLFLTCDLYGVLPPVSVLTVEQAAYYFLSGYTALVGSTEVGSASDVKPTFSACFGAPFFPRPAAIYADLLMQQVNDAGATVYLVNTGWTGGAYGKGGQRFSIPTTRRIVEAVINGELTHCEKRTCGGFNLSVPTDIQGIDKSLLMPENQWADAAAFKVTANDLIVQFQENFKRFDVEEEILAAGPCSF
jgi:phosphoenolpyruvate carboxykinase (ATP)